MKKIALLVLASILVAFSITDSLDDLIKKIEKYVEENPQEKIHLHLDKPYYAVGEDIWFKAYVTDTRTGLLTSNSVVLYVQLINEDGVINQKVKLPLIEGLTFGDFKLNDSIPEGNYRVRAYTQLMRNLDPDYFFDKTIKIGNAIANKIEAIASYEDKKLKSIRFTDKKGEALVAKRIEYIIKTDSLTSKKIAVKTNSLGVIDITTINQPNIKLVIATVFLDDNTSIEKIIPIKLNLEKTVVQFFPESGNFIAGNPSRMAFKVINEEGLSENVTGVVVDENELEITKISTPFTGLGSFFITPEPGKKYMAKLKFNDSTERAYQLPTATNTGISLMVSNINDDVINAKIFVSEDFLKSESYKLIVQNNGRVLFSSPIILDKRATKIEFNKTSFPPGVANVTLLDENNNPICERMIFVNIKNDKMKIDLSGLKESYKIKDSVSFTLMATTENKFSYGSFSVSVANASKVIPDEENETNIFTSLLLTSEIKGYIEKPNHYFLKDNGEYRTQLDNLMLTQVYRRILWKDILANKSTAIKYSSEKGLKITGSVVSNNGLPISGGKVTLLSFDGGIYKADTVTDAKGRFSFDKLNFPEGTRFTVQACNLKGKKDVKLTIDSASEQTVTMNKNFLEIVPNVNQTMSSYFKQSEAYFNKITGSLLKEVVVRTKRNPAIYSRNPNGPGVADFVLDGKKLQDNYLFQHAIRGRIPGLISTNNPSMPYKYQGFAVSIFINGMPADSTELENLATPNIMSVELLTYGRALGYPIKLDPISPNAILEITMLPGRTIYNGNAPGILTILPKGFNYSRNFYEAIYNTRSQNASNYRNLIYWNPTLTTNMEGKVTFGYKNASEPGEYRVVIEGIDTEGNIGRGVFYYNVRDGI